MLASYIFDYVQIYFNNYLKHKNVIFKFFKIEGSLELGSQKHFLDLVAVASIIAKLYN
jgi:hypothetical protein